MQSFKYVILAVIIFSAVELRRFSRHRYGNQSLPDAYHSYNRNFSTEYHGRRLNASEDKEYYAFEISSGHMHQISELALLSKDAYFAVINTDQLLPVLDVTNRRIEELPNYISFSKEWIEHGWNPVVYQKHNHSRFSPVQAKSVLLYGNNISEIKYHSLDGLNDAEMLNISRSHVNDLLPGCFSSTSKLKYLIMHNNNLSELRSNVLVGLHKLEYVDLSSNAIAAIEEAAFYNLPMLKTLNLTDNAIMSIALPVIQRLQNLQLSGNPFEVLRENVFNYLAALTILNMKQVGIAEIPDQLFSKNPRLVQIDVSSSKIGKIGDGAFRGLGNLKCLNVSSNVLSTLVPWVNALTAIETLDISYNPITNIVPKETLTNLLNMVDLRMMFTSVNYPPMFPEKLEYLYFTGSRDKIIRMNNFRRLSSLRELYISNVQDMEIGPMMEYHELRKLVITRTNKRKLRLSFFSYCRKLKILDVSQNLLSSLQADISITQLRKLNISNNVIANCWELGIAGLPNLKKLVLSHNLLFDIESSAGFRECFNYKVVDLSFNYLSKLPACMVNMPKCEVLKLGNNVLKTDLKILDTVQLKVLDLSNAGLTSIYQIIVSNLQTIEELYLSRNNISSIPDDLCGKMYRLRILDLRETLIQNLNVSQLTKCDHLEHVYLSLSTVEYMLVPMSSLATSVHHAQMLNITKSAIWMKTTNDTTLQQMPGDYCSIDWE